MRAIPKLTIPAGETVKLERGGKHLMLMRPTAVQDTVALHFYFNDTLVLSVDAALESETE